MIGDPLDKYKKKPITPSEIPTKKSSGEYLAFDAKDLCDRVRVRSGDVTRAPRYNLLLDVVSDSEYGTSFILVFTFLCVYCKGRNLQPVVKALEMNTADFIQEFDSTRWPTPQDDKAPFIESIKVVEGETSSLMQQTNKGGKEKQPGLNLH